MAYLKLSRLGFDLKDAHSLHIEKDVAPGTRDAHEYVVTSGTAHDCAWGIPIEFLGYHHAALCPCFRVVVRVIYEKAELRRGMLSRKERPSRRADTSTMVAIHRALWFTHMDSGSIIFLLLVLVVAATGCQLTQSAFTRTAGNAGSAFAAASTTLSYLHEGKISRAYAASSFVNYASELDGLDQTLPSLSGAPDARTLQHLLSLYKPAMQVVNSPCLDASCAWRAQVAILDRASKAFLEVGNS